MWQMVLKYAVVLNAVFMMIFLGARMTIYHSRIGWIALDALIVLACLWVAQYYDDDNVW